MFRPIKNNTAVVQRVHSKASQTVVYEGCLVEDGTTGTYKIAPAATEKVEYVSVDKKVVASGQTPKILVVKAAGSNIRFLADTVADTALAQVGKVYELSSDTVLDNGTASSSANGFFVEEIVGNAANRQVIGRFI